MNLRKLRDFERKLGRVLAWTVLLRPQAVTAADNGRSRVQDQARGYRVGDSVVRALPHALLSNCNLGFVADSAVISGR